MHGQDYSWTKPTEADVKVYQEWRSEEVDI